MYDDFRGQGQCDNKFRARIYFYQIQVDKKYNYLLNKHLDYDFSFEISKRTTYYLRTSIYMLNNMKVMTKTIYFYLHQIIFLFVKKVRICIILI